MQPMETFFAKMQPRENKKRVNLLPSAELVKRVVKVEQTIVKIFQ